MERIDNKTRFVPLNRCLILICSVFLFGAPNSMAQDINSECYKILFSTEIPYGADEGNLGFVDEEEMPNIGPSSFTNDAEGNLYVCDTVNRRIQIYSNDGAYQSTVALPKKITPIDIVVDNSNYLFVYDHSSRQLYQVDRGGEILNSVKLNKRDTPCVNSMHIVANNIYRRTCDENDMLIGNIQNDLLLKPSEESEQMQKGILSLSKRRYALELLKGKKGIIYLYDGSNQLAGRKKLMDLDIQKPLSLKFLTEDKNGNFYLQTERLVGKDVVLEVRKYNADGDQLCVLPIEDTDYAAWPIRLLQVDSDGRIWQLVPGAENARLHVFSPSSIE